MHFPLLVLLVGSASASQLLRGPSQAATRGSDVNDDTAFVKKNMIGLRQLKPVRAKEHVAMLVSGQISRFTYIDSLRHVPGGLSGLACGAPEGSKCPSGLEVDVYVVVSNTSGKFWAQKAGMPVQPPYGDGAFTPERIREYYLRKGAHHVNITVLSQKAIDDRFSDIEDKVKIAGGGANSTKQSSSEWWMLRSQVPKFKLHWEPHGKAFLMRHLAYSAAAAAEHSLPYKYSHVLSAREDNAFVNPTYSLEALMKQISKPVAVDQYCGFGSYSDKLYFADRLGADNLLGRTTDQHVGHMVGWLDFALKESVPSTQSERTRAINITTEDPMQPEAWVQQLLASTGTGVTTFDFNRTDIRYVRGSEGACTPALYYKCTAKPGEAFPSCPEVKKN